MRQQGSRSKPKWYVRITSLMMLSEVACRRPPGTVTVTTGYRSERAGVRRDLASCRGQRHSAGESQPMARLFKFGLRLDGPASGGLGPRPTVTSHGRRDCKHRHAQGTLVSAVASAPLLQFDSESEPVTDGLSSGRCRLTQAHDSEPERRNIRRRARAGYLVGPAAGGPGCAGATSPASGICRS